MTDISGSGALIRKVASRNLPVILAAVFAIVVMIQFVPHYLSTNEGRPYEIWDEMETFDSANVLALPTADRTFRYGSIDTFLQWAATVGYDYLDIIGAGYPHLRYANNVPASWNDPLLPFHERNWQAGMDYSFFRGIDDRSAIFISRTFHLLCVYAIILAIGLTAIAVLGANATYVVLPLLLLSVAPEFYYQAAHSLPNAINAVLAFGIVFFAMLFADRSRSLYLLISAACLAIGLNVKPDIVVMGSAIGLALLLSILQGNTKFALISGLKAGLVGGLVFVITDPIFLANPVYYTRGVYHVIRDFTTSSRGLLDNAILNSQILNAFLGGSLLWKGAGWGLGLAIAILSACLAAAIVKRTTPYLAIAVGAVVTIFTLGGLVLKAHGPLGWDGVADRYFLTGLAAFLATVAMGLLVVERGTSRRAARLAVGVVFVVFCGHAIVRATHSVAMYASYRASDGFDPGNHQTMASLLAVKMAKQGDYAPLVLVDQHAYIDLYVFRHAGLDARYINLANLDTVLADLPRGRKYLVVFGRGDYSSLEQAGGRMWEGEWNETLRQKYDSYQRQLSALPVLRYYPGPRPRLLALDPVNGYADITLAVLAVP